MLHEPFPVRGSYHQRVENMCIAGRHRAERYWYWQVTISLCHHILSDVFFGHSLIAMTHSWADFAFFLFFKECIESIRFLSQFIYLDAVGFLQLPNLHSPIHIMSCKKCLQVWYFCHIAHPQSEWYEIHVSVGSAPIFLSKTKKAFVYFFFFFSDSY